jgi:O-acetyl-ADP-ribose deacetylase (regulator of RNase III)
MPIQYLKGDATEPQHIISNNEEKLIIHVCNNLGLWGAGFVLALNKKWTEPKKVYLNLKAYTVGTVQYVPVTENITVVNMIAQRGVNSKFAEFKQRVDYEVLRNCLKEIATLYQDRPITIHAPRFGAGLAGGKWIDIEKIINEELSTFKVFIYDL